MSEPAPEHPEMTARDLCRYLDLFEELGITVWLGGGWGVDALLGEQTRRHADLDIVLDEEATKELCQALFNLGFEDVETDDRTVWNFVMGNSEGHRLDFHVVEFDDRGDGIYGPPERGVSFPAPSFTGRGEICGREVHCLDPEFQVESHTGYGIDDDDIHDVLALCARFGLAIPSEYRKYQAENPLWGSPADDPSSAVVAGYEHLASSWDDWAGAAHPDLRARYLERLAARLSPGSNVLELGCGTGRPVGTRLAPMHRYLGIDSSPRMVERAQQNVTDGRFQVADMTTLDLPENSFDAVVAFYSIIHVPRDDQPALFSRIRSWLRPGGQFVGCLSSGDLPEGWEEDWLGGGPMYWSGFDANINRRLLEDVGLEVDSSEVLTQMEGDTEVRFLWVEAHIPEVSSESVKNPL